MTEKLDLTKVRPGDMLVTDGTWPEGSPMDKGLRGVVGLGGNYLTWRAPFGIDIDITADDEGHVIGFTRPPLEAA